MNLFAIALTSLISVSAHAELSDTYICHNSQFGSGVSSIQFAEGGHTYINGELVVKKKGQFGTWRGNYVIFNAGPSANKLILALSPSGQKFVCTASN